MRKEVPVKGNIFGCGCIPARYTFAILGCFGVALVYGLKVNLHVAILIMVNNTYIHSLKKGGNASVANVSVCNYKTAKNTIEDGKFLWSESAQGAVLSSYFVGYLLGQLPGGRIAEMYSAFWVFLMSALVNIACTLLTPVSAAGHWMALAAVRTLMGLAAGCNLPSMHVLLAHWCPSYERSIIASIVYAGVPLGTVVFQLSTGYIAHHVSWQAVFYVHGIIGSVFVPLWWFMVSETPRVHPYITQEERDEICSHTAASMIHLKIKVPWKSILTSVPFYAILVAHICSDWGFYMLLIELPQYMKRVLSFSLTEITTYTAVPYLTMWIFSLANGKILDGMMRSGRLTTTCTRKVSTTIQASVAAVCLALVCVVRCSRPLAVACCTVALTCYGGMFAGFLCNHIDIAPNFAGTLLAITNGMAAIGGIVVPLFCGELFHTATAFGPWMILFSVTIGLLILELFVYNCFASGEVQPWNSPVPVDGDFSSILGGPVQEDRK